MGTVGVVDWKVPDEKQRVEDIDELGNTSYRVGEDHTQFRLRLTEIKETSAKCTIAKEPEKEHTEGTIEQSVTECVEANGGLQAKLQERLCLSIERIIGFLDSQFDTFRLLCENSGSLAEDVKKLRKTTEEQGCDILLFKTNSNLIWIRGGRIRVDCQLAVENLPYLQFL